jgi:tetratricopeptide (TPR) repeat protein
LPGLGNRPGGDGARPSQLPARQTPQQRRDNLQNQLASRDQVRDREQWQDRRENVREDWHGRYDDFYDRHDDWHHGHWHGNASDWWHHMWDDHTAFMAFGTTLWGINQAAYGFGYWGYENPYYTEVYPVSDEVVLDYSEPIAVETAPAETTQPSDAPVPGMAEFDAARAAFLKGDYAGALASTNKALAALPNDPIIHEFRALIMFAQGKYKEAAAGLYSVLTVGPGWDWATMSSLYPNVGVYTQQLRALEKYVKEHKDARDAQFVLVYHYLATGNKDAATKGLQVLHKATPDDRLVTELLLMNAGPEAIGAKVPTDDPSAPAPPVVAAAELLGTWTAAGEGGTKFSLLLNNEGLFSWKYTEDGKEHAVKGVYALDGNVLALEPETGGVMLSEVTRPKDGKFNFKLLGAPESDSGLKFAKSR